MIKYAITIERFRPTLGEQIAYAHADEDGAYWNGINKETIKLFSSALDARDWFYRDDINFKLYNTAAYDWYWSYNMDSVQIVQLQVTYKTIEKLTFEKSEEDDEQ